MTTSIRARWRAASAALLATALLSTGCGNRTTDTGSNAVARTAPSASNETAPQAGTDQATSAAPGPGAVPVAAPQAGFAPPVPSKAGSTDVATPAQAPRPARAAAPVPKNGGNSPTGARPSDKTASGASDGPSRGAASNTPAPGAPVPGATPAACTKSLSPLVLGSVTTMSGLVGETVNGGAKAVQAWAAARNASGGFLCHPIKYVIADDGADPNRHQSLVQQLFERDKAVAFLYNGAPLSGYSSVNYVNQKHVPVIGNEGGSSWFYDSQYFFPHALSGGAPFAESFFAATALSDAAQGKKKIAAISCVEAPICSSTYSQAEAAAKKFHLELVYNAQATLTQPDYTSQCLQAQSKGAEVLALSIDGNSIHRLARSCESVGYKPILVTVVVNVRPDYSSDPAIGGFIGATHTLPWFNSANPLMKEMHTVMAKYAPGLVESGASASGWVVAKLFESAVQTLPDPPTSDSILESLWKVKSNDVGGLTAPLTFTKGQPSKVINCIWAPYVKDGHWAGGDQRFCP
jgi:branched-chain amino acid transport system substrate-binding protein